MAIEIIGSPTDVKRYRKLLHEQGYYTKRFQKEIDSGLMLPKHDDYRVLKAQFHPVMKGQKKFEPEDDVIISGVANQNAVDRMDERLEPSGVDIDNFMKNPVLLIDHLYLTRATVGDVKEVMPEHDGVKFLAKIGDPNAAPLTETQREIRSLVAQKLLQTVSVGFIPHKIRAPEFDADGKLVEPAVILQWELLELSIVAVPANPGSTFEMRNITQRFYRSLGFPSNKTNKTDGPKLTSSDDILKNKTNSFSKQSAEVQTLIFSKEVFSEQEAVDWAKEHDFKADKVDETDDSYRLRQRSPEDFQDESFRTIELDDGIKAVVGRLKDEDKSVMEEKVGELLDKMRELISLVSAQSEGVKKTVELSEQILTSLDADKRGGDMEEEEEEKITPDTSPNKEEDDKEEEEEEDEDMKSLSEDISSLKATVEGQGKTINKLAEILTAVLEKG